MSAASGQAEAQPIRDDNATLGQEIVRESKEDEALAIGSAPGEPMVTLTLTDTEADSVSDYNSALSEKASHPTHAGTEQDPAHASAVVKALQAEGVHNASCSADPEQQNLETNKNRSLSSVALQSDGGGAESEVAKSSVPAVKGGKRLLERWLDQLFTALYQDIMCSVIWNAQELHVQQTHALLNHTVGDYLRFGILSKRLGKKDEACKAFKMCTSQGFCLRGLLNILDIYSRDGFVEESLAACAAIGRFYDMHADLAMPVEVDHAVYRLIAKHGLTMLSQLGGQWVNKDENVKKIIAKAVAWQVKGYDK